MVRVHPTFASSPRRLAFALLVAVAGLAWWASPAAAQTADPAKPPAAVADYLRLQNDPAVRNWMKEQAAAADNPAAPAAQPAGPAARPVVRADDIAFDASVARMRSHVAGLVAAVPVVPAELARVGSRIAAEVGDYGPLRLFVVFAVFTAAGLVAQWLYWHFTAGQRAWIASANRDGVRDRLIAIAARLGYTVGAATVFAVGSIGTFLAFDWPPFISQIVLGCLTAYLFFRLAQVAIDFLLAPADRSAGDPAGALRVLPIAEPAASFWAKWLCYAAGWFICGLVVVRLLVALGTGVPVRQLVAYALGSVLLAIGLAAIWKRPERASEEPAAGLRDRLGHRAVTWIVSIVFVLLWLSWFAGAMRAFWLLLVVVGLPIAVIAAQRSVNNVLRAAGAPLGGRHVPSVLAAIVERGARATLVIAAVLFLADRLGVDFTAMTAQDTIVTRVMRGALSAIVIVLAADFLWHVARTVIDRRLADAEQHSEPGTEIARRNARLRTLLPIVRNVLKIVIVIVALLMALSSLGVEIGPLIAGAGILGVAIGFGAQTVVKDVISGVFYLLDDAFRVGEYIQSGSYKGTVESFSLRSVMLRHHRGSIYTVPFSDLGAIQNMSRDWVVEKITMSVTYDSDVDKARKIVKRIGQELAQDPEFAASTIEPLKMQGVDEFGDSGMLLRMKLKTRPGEQFGIKRRALMLIKRAFDENGIKLAVPMVQISGDDEQQKLAAAQHLRLKQQALAEAAAGE